MSPVKILNIIKDRYEYFVQSRIYQHHINHFQQEISFYHIVHESDLKSFEMQIDGLNKDILKFVQSNYFYKVISLRKTVNDEFFKDDESNEKVIVYINRIQVSKIEKSRKTAHLAVINTLKDLYV